MSQSTVSMCALSEEQRARVGLYGLLARLLSSHPDETALAELAALPGDDTEIGEAIGEIAKLAKQTTANECEEEFNVLFIGVTEGELLPFGSHYLSGFLHDMPLAEVRTDLTRLGIERADDVKEPEDHIAFLLEVMVGLIAGEFGHEGENEEQKFFETHIASWADKFFRDLENAENAKFYRPVGILGQRFLDIETKGFRIAA